MFSDIIYSCNPFVARTTKWRFGLITIEITYQLSKTLIVCFITNYSKCTCPIEQEQMIAKALALYSQQSSQYTIHGNNNSSNTKASSLETFDYQPCTPKVSYSFLQLAQSPIVSQLAYIVSYNFLVGLVSNSFLVSLVSQSPSYIAQSPIGSYGQSSLLQFSIASLVFQLAYSLL